MDDSTLVGYGWALASADCVDGFQHEIFAATSLLTVGGADVDALDFLQIGGCEQMQWSPNALETVEAPCHPSFCWPPENPGRAPLILRDFLENPGQVPLILRNFQGIRDKLSYCRGSPWKYPDVFRH